MMESRTGIRWSSFPRRQGTDPILIPGRIGYAANAVDTATRRPSRTLPDTKRAGHGKTDWLETAKQTSRKRQD